VSLHSMLAEAKKRAMGIYGESSKEKGYYIDDENAELDYFICVDEIESRMYVAGPYNMGESKNLINQYGGDYCKIAKDKGSHSDIVVIISYGGDVSEEKFSAYEYVAFSTGDKIFFGKDGKVTVLIDVKSKEIVVAG